MSQLTTMGRPRHADDPELRARMVAAAVDWKIVGASLDRVAFYYRVHPNTVKNWTRQALRLKGPDGDKFRAMVRLRDALHSTETPDLSDDGGDDPPDDCDCR